MQEPDQSGRPLPCITGAVRSLAPAHFVSNGTGCVGKSTSARFCTQIEFGTDPICRPGPRNPDSDSLARIVQFLHCRNIHDASRCEWLQRGLMLIRATADPDRRSGLAPALENIVLCPYPGVPPLIERPSTAQKTMVLTGASRGIGQAIAHALGKAGATVIGTSTSAEGAARMNEAYEAPTPDDADWADAIVFGSNRSRHLGRLFSPQVRERTTRLTSLPILTAPAPLRVTAAGMRHAVQAQVDAEIASFRG